MVLRNPPDYVRGSVDSPAIRKGIAEIDMADYQLHAFSEAILLRALICGGYKDFQKCLHL